MRRNADRPLIVLAVVVGLGLTGLTVWAVARQSRALLARERADLRNAATKVAAERTAQLRGDVERAFGGAALAWRMGGKDGLDWWVSEQRRWAFALMQTAADSQQAFPIPPMHESLPTPEGEEFGPPFDPDFTPEEAWAALARFEQLAESDDALTRARALLGAADCHRRLGDLQAAARRYEQTAQVLRSEGRLARHAFEAEVESIACLLALGEAARARQAVEILLDEMSSAHPARYCPAEVDLLRRRAGALFSGEAGTEISERLDKLERRAQIRAALPVVTDVLLEMCRPGDEAADEDISFRTVRSDAVGRLVVAARRISAGECLALAGRASDLVGEYWEEGGSGGWRVASALEGDDEPLLCLGEPFGGAWLVPSGAAAERLAAHSRRGTALVAATAAGTAGAWGVVIWVMLRAMARQRELVRLQRRFVADMSHELKTPLAMIRLLAETLQDGRVRDPERVEAYYGTITREAERLSVLLDGILDFSRIESGRKQYEFADCDVGDVARQAWALFEPQLGGAGFERKLEIEPDLPIIRADPAAVQQVIVNLLQNAFRYAGDEKYIRLAVAREGYVVVITVEDHGIGMTKAQLERLGDTFFRAEDTRVRQTRGSGLGLAIVNHVVQAHGGKLEVHSRPGKGSTFTVWIPFEPPGGTGKHR